MEIPPNGLTADTLTALTESAAALNSSLDLDAVLQTIARSACTVTHAEAASVLLMNDRRSQFVVVAATGRRRDALLGREFDKGAGIPGEVLKVAQTINLPDVRNTKKFDRDIDDIGNSRTLSLIAAPMLHRSEVIGVIEVVNRWDGQPFDDVDEKALQLFATFATIAAQNAKAFENLRRQFDAVRDAATKHPPMIGECSQIQEVLDLARRVAPSNATVLVTGESGTGKELAARFIHTNSRRKGGAFIAVNCAALTETLLESELFGHEQGAFTGASAKKTGWFETASGGTLFLDEIGEISKATQAKLLRVLQEREFVRVGGAKPIACDVRIIAATNRDLKKMMATGDFREDLYYRLSVFPIAMPALRERPGDVALLARHFIKRTAQNMGLPEPRIDEQTVAVLANYAWPGNIRELQNVVERAVLMCENGRLEPHHLPADLRGGAPVGSNGALRIASSPNSNGELTPLADQERALIVAALQQCEWNQSEAARRLGITRDLLRTRVKKHNISRPRHENGGRP